MTKLISFLSQTIILISLCFLYNFALTIYDKDQQKVYPTHLHTTLYVDRNFDDDEISFIKEAADEWKQATNGIIEYDVVKLPIKDKMVATTKLLVLKVSPDYPDIIELDSAKTSTTVGYFREHHNLPYIEIVSERINTDKMYKSVVLHELGHSLGLQHLEDLEDMDALMYPYTSIKIDNMIIPTGSDHVTKKDLVQLCRLYHCNPKNLKH